MKQIKRAFSSTVTSNIIGAIGLLTSLALGFLAENPYWAIIAMIATALVFIVFIYFINRYAKRASVIDAFAVLSRIQNKCVVNPHYPTNQEHGINSREKDLRQSGDGCILTNSLAYDIFYCKEIVDNIMNGAKYSYILPNNEFIHIELANFITAIAAEFAVPSITLEQVKQFYKDITFYMLPVGSVCLYNFARFHQPGRGMPAGGFTQSWWYVHAAQGCEQDPSAHMLSNEIEDRNDQENLNRALQLLKNLSKPYSGLEIDDYHDQLGDFLKRSTTNEYHASVLRF